MTETTRTPAGWYPDPLGLPQLRWWDTSSWTEHTSDATEPALAWADDEAPPRAPLPAEEPAGEVSTRQEPTRPEPARPEQTRPEPTRAVDWRELASAVVDARASLDPVLIQVRSEAVGSIVIDPVHRAFWWDRPLAEFPMHAEGTEVLQIPQRLVRASLGAGRDLEPLLWLIGARTSASAPVMRVDPRRRLRLRRWPNLTTVAHTSAQMSMTAMLGHASLTSTELAALASVAEVEAAHLLATYRLMGLLVEAERPAAPTASVPVADAAPATGGGGLFQRLRMRLGID